MMVLEVCCLQLCRIIMLLLCVDKWPKGWWICCRWMEREREGANEISSLVLLSGDIRMMVMKINRSLLLPSASISLQLMGPPLK